MTLDGDRQRTARTRADGTFRFRMLPVGQAYTLRAEHDGYHLLHDDRPLATVSVAKDGPEVAFVGLTDDEALTRLMERAQERVGLGVTGGDRVLVEAAWPDLSAALEIDPDHEEARFLRGYSAWFAGDYEACMDDLDELDPGDRQGMLAWCQLGAGQMAAAERAWKAEVEASGSADALVGLAVLHQRRGQTDEAAQFFLAAADDRRELMGGRPAVQQEASLLYNRDEWATIERVRRHVRERERELLAAVFGEFSEPFRAFLNRPGNALREGERVLPTVVEGFDGGVLTLGAPTRRRGESFEVGASDFFAHVALRYNGRYSGQTSEGWAGLVIRGRYLLVFFPSQAFSLYTVGSDGRIGPRVGAQRRAGRFDGAVERWNEVEVLVRGDRLAVFVNGSGEHVYTGLAGAVSGDLAVWTAPGHQYAFDDVIAFGIGR